MIIDLIIDRPREGNQQDKEKNDNKKKPTRMMIKTKKKKKKASREILMKSKTRPERNDKRISRCSIDIR